MAIWRASMWSGVTLRGWLRVLARNRFRVSPVRWHRAMAITAAALTTGPLRAVQQLFFGRRARQATLEADPIFIVGYWRSGTTLLHELLALDPRHTAPNTYQCATPSHFILTEEFAQRWLRFLLPAARPMDNMRMAWEKPQEDELALANLGVPSPFWSIAFSREPLQNPRYFELTDLSEQELQCWKDTWLQFLREVQFEHPGRLVLKSPFHSFRLPVIRQMFPAASFIRIVRNPYDVYPSTLHFWRKMADQWGLQRGWPGLDEFVLESFERMERILDQTLPAIPAEQQYLLRFEDLVADPLAQLEELYAHFGWDAEAAKPTWKQYLEGAKDYRQNRFERSPAERRQIAERWGGHFEKYGYER